MEKTKKMLVSGLISQDFTKHKIFIHGQDNEKMHNLRLKDIPSCELK